MRTLAPTSFCKIAGACFLAHILGLWITCGFHASDVFIAYPDPLQWAAIGRGMFKITPAAVKYTFDVFDWLFLGIAPMGVVLAWRTRHEPRSRARIAFFATQPLLFFPGWMGFLFWAVFPYEVQKLDGEWMSERTLQAMTLACWVLASILIARLSWSQTPRMDVRLLPRSPELNRNHPVRE